MPVSQNKKHRPDLRTSSGMSSQNLSSHRRSRFQQKKKQSVNHSVEHKSTLLIGVRIAPPPFLMGCQFRSRHSYNGRTASENGTYGGKSASIFQGGCQEFSFFFSGTRKDGTVEVANNNEMGWQLLSK
jgi:hypothetical protein